MILTTEQLLGRGLTSQSMSRAVAAGELIRLRPGFYVEQSARDLHRDARHLLSVLAADSALGAPVFSHWSAALVLGLPSRGLPLRKVAVSGSGNGRRSQSTSQMRHHTVPVCPEEVTSIDGLRVTVPARTVVDLALCSGRDTTVTIADAALQNALVTPEALNDSLHRAAGRSGIKRARAAMRLVDRRSESVAETLSRLCFADYGLPEPELQVDIFDLEGEFVARVDFLWPEFGVVGECDGFGKYFDGADAAEVRRRLGREKDRDAALMALGYRVIHWRWADLDRPWVLAERIRSVLYPAAA